LAVFEAPWTRLPSSERGFCPCRVGEAKKQKHVGLHSIVLIAASALIDLMRCGGQQEKENRRPLLQFGFRA